MGTAALVWLGSAAVAAVIALLGVFTYAAGNDTLVQGPQGVRRVVTQGALSDSVSVYRPVSSHLYVFESGLDNGLRHRLGQGRCTISEDQASRSVLTCGDTVTTLGWMAGEGRSADKFGYRPGRSGRRCHDADGRGASAHR
jgi:hypothetical protein